MKREDKTIVRSAVAGLVVFCARLGVWGSPATDAATNTLGDRLEVLWDTNQVASLDRVRLVLHEPKLREVSIVHDRPWEGNVCCYHTVFQDGGRCRLYYRGANWGFVDAKRRRTKRRRSK